jgi:hypothetical protein
MMAGATGLEPTASCVTGRRSNHLNSPANESSVTCNGFYRFQFFTVSSISLSAVTGQHCGVTYWILTVLTARS